MLRLDGGNLRRHQSFYGRVTVAGDWDFSDFELYVTVRCYEDLRRPPDIASIVVADACFAPYQLWTFALGIVLDGPSTGDALLNLLWFHVGDVNYLLLLVLLLLLLLLAV